MDGQPVAPGPGRARRFILTFVVVFVLLTAGSIAVSVLQFGHSTALSADFCSSIEDRVALGQAMDSPKLVLIGGSGVRRGINAAMMADQLGLPVLNFGLHAGLGPRLILHNAERVLRPGDVALLVLEYNHYVYDRFSPYALELIFDCMPEVFAEATPLRKAEILFAAPVDRAFRALTYDGAAAAPTTYPPMPGAIGLGDLPLTEQAFPPLTEEQRERVAYYRPINIGVNRASLGVAAIARFVAWAHEHGVTVLATWPNTIDHPAYRTETGFREIRGLYAALGVPVIGDPSLGLYPVDLFYDTQYHLGPAGIVERTQDLIDALKAAGPPLPQPTPSTPPG